MLARAGATFGIARPEHERFSHAWERFFRFIAHTTRAATLWHATCNYQKQR
jgi:hypothetical protein